MVGSGGLRASVWLIYSPSWMTHFLRLAARVSTSLTPLPYALYVTPTLLLPII